MDAVGSELVRAALQRATAGQLADLGAALQDDDGVGDPEGMARVWARLILGLDSPGDRYALASDRRQAALALAWRNGGLSSGDLARATGCSGEAARLTLVALAQAGQLVAQGDGRGRRYLSERGAR